LSQDKFWEQWAAGQDQPGEKPAEGDKPAEEPGKEAGTTDSSTLGSDALAAWLQSLPGSDPADPLVPQVPPAVPAAGGETSTPWPPAAPVDPFTGIQKSGGSPSAVDWDLALDLDSTPAPPAPPEPPAGPAPAGPGTTQAPAPGPAPLGDFDFDFDALAGPTPVADPFAPPDTAVPPAGPSAEAEALIGPPPVPAGLPAEEVRSPFGPPPPPVAPPAEALEAPPLKLEVNVGRRSFELAIQGEALIGRPDATRGLHPEIDLRLDDAVSRRHAKIFVRNGRYVLTDLNSTNGTRYNRDWLQPEVEVTLKAGDEIEVGEATLIRVLEAPEPHGAME
jgi:FHA domain-containing protein